MNHKTQPLSKWLLFGSLYTTQYIGVGFLFIALTAILRKQGVPLSEISKVYVLGLPWMFKFIWAPLVDRFSPFKQIGHYRSWIFLMQTIMIICLLSISFLSIEHHLYAIIKLGLIFCCASATQDIAVDSLSSLEFDDHERATLNSVQSSGVLFGNILGGGIILICYQYIGWTGALLMITAVTAISWIQLLFFTETSGLKEDIVSMTTTFSRFFKVWKGTGLWFFVIIFVVMGYSVLFGITKPMLVDKGLTLAEIGTMTNLFGSVMGIIGGFTAGILIKKIGRQQALRFFPLFQLCGLMLYFHFIHSDSMLYMYFTIALYYTFFTFNAVLLTTLMMDRSSKSTTPGTDYTIQFAMVMIFGKFSAGFLMYAAHTFGYTMVVCFAITSTCIAIGVIYRHLKYTQYID